MGKQERIAVVPRFEAHPGATNVYMDCGDFGISFNPSPWAGVFALEADTDDGETAIVIPDGEAGRRFFILNGDFRDEYAAIAPQGLAACLQFFAAHPTLVSSWSASIADAATLSGEAR